MKERLVVTTVGDLNFQLGGENVPGFSSRKAEALLVYLAVGKSTAHRRESLFTLLWPGMPESSARNNLRQVLFTLRQSFPEVASRHKDEEPVPLLLADRQTVQINPAAAVVVDIQQIDQLLEDTQVHDHLNLAGCEVCLQSLEQVISIYRGNFLTSFYLDDSSEFEDWAEANREVYRGKALSTFETLTDICIQKGDYEGASTYAEGQLRIDPLRETAYRQLMELYSKSGQRTEALRTYQRCARILDIELGTSPSRETTALYEIISGEDLRQAAATPREGSIRGFQIREHLGSGHTGMVYRAFQPVINRDVAVKVIAPQFSNHPDFIRRFEVEAQLVARLEHPYIVPLYDYWRDPSGAYLVMRWLKGGSLQDDLARGPWMPEPAVQFLNQISAALSFAHRQGVVHCDIKPANILLDEENSAYLSDFGIAILTGPLAQLSQYVDFGEDGSSSGSLGYTSPEVARGQQTTPLADVYSLGVVLFELLTARHPFLGVEGDALIQKHLTEPLPPVLKLRTELPPAVDDVIQQATNKDPGRRFQDVNQLAQAFRQAIYPETGVQTEVSDIVFEVRNPYKGLRPFDEADSADFFGRDDLIDRLLSRLSSKDGVVDPERFLAVVGPSGSGKSSVVKAGLIPAIRKGAIPGSEGWFMVEMTPGSHPLEELETALLRIAIETPEDLLFQLRSDPRGLLRVLRKALPGVKNEVMLVIDQFEELFTLVADEVDRKHFMEMLAVAVSDPHSPLRILITLRADFYDRPLEHGEFGELIRGATEVVLPLNPEELERAISGPAEQVRTHLEPQLVARIVQEVGDQPGALPLLQYALTETFEHRENNQLTLTTYEVSGGVLGALGRRAEEIYGGLEDAEQETARQLFLRLVTLGEGTEDTRRRVLLSELDAVLNRFIEGRNRVIDQYSSYRLLTFDHDPATRTPTVEVAHEALLREWPRLRLWLDESRDDVRMQRLLGVSVQEWRKSGNDTSFLLHGTRLDQFEIWAGDTDVALTAAEAAYLAASMAARRERKAAEVERQAHEAALEQRSKRFLQALVGVFAVATIIAVVLSIYAFNSQRTAQIEAQQRATQQVIAEAEAQARATAQSEAEEERAIAEEQTQLTLARELAFASANNLDVDPERSVLLALEAIKTKKILESTNALHQALPELRIMNTFKVGGYLEGIDFNSDGTELAIVNERDSNIFIWDVINNEMLKEIPFPIESQGAEVKYSPDDSLIAVGGVTSESDLMVFDTKTGNWIHTWISQSGAEAILEGYSGSIDFSPDGTRLAVANLDGLPHVFDLRNGEVVGTLKGHSTLANGLDYSPDGSLIATGGLWVGEVIIWNTETWEPFHILDTGPETIYYIEFSPDGKNVAAVGDGGVLYVWDVETGDKLISQASETAGFRGLLYSFDGKYIYTGGQDGTVRVWDAFSGKNLATFAGHTGVVMSLALSPDRQFIASGSTKGDIKYWDLNPGKELFIVPFNPIGTGLALTPDGSTLAVNSPDNAIELVNPDTGEHLDTFATPNLEEGDYLGRFLFTPDGNYLIAVTVSGLLVFDYVTREQVMTLMHPGGVVGLDITADGRYLVSSGFDNTARFWDLKNGTQVNQYTEHTHWVLDVVFSSDEMQVFSASSDGTVHVWDPFSAETLRVVEASGGLGTILVTPDGRYVIASTIDGYINVWDAETWEPITVFFAHTSGSWDSEMSADGSLLVTAGFEGSAKVWAVPTWEPVATFYGITGTVAEVEISSDGSIVYVGDWDGRLQAYLLDVDALVELAESRLTRNLTKEECQTYLHLDSCPKE